MSDPVQKLTGGELNAAISNAIVAAFADCTGRGPTMARTSIRDDVVLCVMQHTLTKGERSLAADGKSDFVITMRRTFQETMREQLVGSVERLTGRNVIAFMSDNHIEPDVATETFVLEPSPEGEESSERDSATA
jgi:uncharacterized protein YbcI